MTVEFDYSTPFVVPEAATPRQRWSATATRPESGWPKVTVTVTGPEGVVWSFDRNYSFMSTFEPFRQLTPDGVWREFALVSPSYASTSVMDLTTGEIIATEQRVEGEPGFCPVSFHVPDWWEDDARWGPQDGSLVPGAPGWDDYEGWRRGQIGFVAGCVWGDDTSWKVQVLDLSRVTEGIVTRSAPFGYVELPAGVSLADAVYVDAESSRVTFAVPATFSLRTGLLETWSLDGLNRPM